jgi:hypothetical protein
MVENSDGIWDLHEHNLYVGVEEAVLLKPNAATYLRLCAELKEDSDKSLNISCVLDKLSIKCGKLNNPSCLKIVKGSNTNIDVDQALTIKGRNVAIGHEPIAIVGLSCRMPGANNMKEYWNILINGKCEVKPFHDERWTQNQSCNILPQHSNVEAGWLNCPIDEFDGKFFGMSPMEIMYTDPQQRLLLEVAWEAFEDAGINPETVRSTNAAVFGGSWTTEYKELMILSGFSGREAFFRTYLGNSLGNGEIFFKLK